MLFFFKFSAAIALRGAALARGRPRYATAAAAAAAFRHPTPLATAATGLPYTALVSSPASQAAALKYAPTHFLAAQNLCSFPMLF